MKKSLVLLVCLMGWGAHAQQIVPQKENPKPKILCFQDYYLHGDNQGKGSLLFKEVLRQAWVLAATHEMGIQVFDKSMMFDHKNPVKKIVKRLGSSARIEKGIAHVNLMDGKKHLLSYKTTSRLKDGRLGYTSVAATLVEKIGAKFPEVLKKAGFHSQIAAERTAAPLPENLTSQFNTMSYFVQWDNLRKLEDHLHTHGESEEVVCALARVYSNLGQLTRFFWHSMDRSYTARAIILSEKVRILYPNSVRALVVRAYTRTMAGLFSEAIEDLKLIRKMGDNTKLYKTEIETLEAFTSQDITKLNSLRDKNRSYEPAALLQAISAERMWGTAKIQQVTAALSTIPHCMHANEIFINCKGLSIKRSTTRACPIGFAKEIYTRLHQVQPMPSSVKKILLKGHSLFTNVENAVLDVTNEEEMIFLDRKIRPELIEALRNVPFSNKHAIHYRQLATMIDQTTFLHLYHRLKFLTDTWSVDNSELMALIPSMVKFHPLRKFLDVFKERGLRNNVVQLKKTIRGIKIKNPKLNMFPLFVDTWKGHEPRKNTLGWYGEYSSLLYCDETAYDQEMAINIYCHRKQQKQELNLAVKKLIKINPYSVAARNHLLLDEWDTYKSKIAEWEKQSGDDPRFMSTLAHQYTKKEQWELAKKYLAKQMALAPDKRVCDSLARMYEKLGDDEKWIEAKKLILTLPDPALYHARANTDIATFLMDKGKFKEAVPYADEAASSWSAWGMRSAIRCHTRLGNWQKAEGWIINRANRYKGEELNWLSWCLSTDQGRIDEALSFAKKNIPYWVSRSNNFGSIGYIYQVEGNFKKAKEYYKQVDDTWSGMLYLLAHVAETEEKSRLAVLIKELQSYVLKYQKTDAVNLHRVGVAKELLKKLEGKITLDELKKNIVKVVDGCAVQKVCTCDYFVGRTLELTGEQQTAIAYYKAAIEKVYQTRFNGCRGFARMALARIEGRENIFERTNK